MKVWFRWQIWVSWLVGAPFIVNIVNIFILGTQKRPKQQKENGLEKTTKM